METYDISLGSNQGTVIGKSLPWSQIAKRLTSHEVALTKGGPYFVGGAYSSPQRKEANLLHRSMLTLDVDKLDGMSINDLEFELVMGIDAAFIAYSTFSHKPDAPRVRIVVPLSRNVTPEEYREVARDFAAKVGIPFDNCSFVPNQFMYMPTCPALDEAWTFIQEGAPLQVPDVVIAAQRNNDADALEIAVASQPLDISDDEIDAYLAAYGAEGLEYDDWMLVGAALHHQYRGDLATGFKRWLDWSAKSGKHDPKQMPVKWRSFGNSVRVATFASVIHKARSIGANVAKGVSTAPDGVEQKAFDALLERAAAVDSMDAYDAFKARVQRMSALVLPLDKRALLAGEVYDAWGKERGLTKTDIKGQLKPAKRVEDRDKDDIPEWVADWVYVETTCEFYNTGSNYAIKREAFNAKYGREPQCRDAEMLPSVYALDICKIDTVVDLMFWPGVGTFFDHDGKRYLNSYRESGIAPCEVIDADGQAVVDMFMKHVEMTLAIPEERRLLIDFMAWIVQKPGQKVNWALLLQGAQGVGKSYFGVVMQLVMGHMVRQVEPQALSGRFTSWAHGALLAIVEEIRIAGENRYETIDRLKPFISNPTIQIEEKGRDQRTVPNFTSYMLFTNHKDALPLNEGDRRYAPLFSRIQSEAHLFSELGGREAAADYFTRLFDESERRADALAAWLRQWPISSEFNAKGRAPHTSAREEMIALAVSPDRSMIEDAIDQHRCEIINDEVIDITWLNDLCEGHGQELPKTRTLSAVLLDMGYQQVTKRRVKANGRYHYVWVRGTDSEKAKAAVRDFHKGSEDDPDWCPF